MTTDHTPAETNRGTAAWGALRWLRAFAVHVLTASGAALSLLALAAATSAEWPRMFVWLGLALFVDAFDGTLARYWHVKELLPRWSGDTLDLVVDYLTYVFVPAYAILVGRLLPSLAAIPCTVLILITSALYFADRRMKTPDNYFRGFPALWNVVAFYLFLLRLDAWLSAAAVIILCGLMFVPFSFLHPLRVVRLRTLSIAVLVAWSVLAIAAIVSGMDPAGPIKLALSLIAVYFLAIGLLRRPVATRS